MHSVSVLMSTYNGERYLKEQIDSILGQDGVIVNLFVRDDGSTDGTKRILEQYELNGKLKWYSGNNLKAAYSFMHLLKNIPEDEFYAFSDQDDVWESNKLLAGVTKLVSYPKDEVVLYTCNVRVVSSNLTEVGSLDSSVPVTTFMDSVIRNNNQGCTMIFGNALRNLLIMYDGNNLVMHDDLAVKTCLAVGGLVYRDQEMYVNYRQHGDNVVGAKEPLLQMINRRFFSLINHSCERSMQLQDILEIYGKYMPDENKAILKKVA